MGIKIEQTGGNSGRTFVILSELGAYLQPSQLAFDALCNSSKVIKLSSSAIQTSTWEDLADQLQQVLSASGVRQFSFVAFGDSSALAQNLYLRDPKSVRAMILVGATYRPHPTLIEKSIDWLESRFPLGLPLRSEGKQFNSLSHLQRIRCPVLLITTESSSMFEVAQAKDAAVRMPTSWHVQLENLDDLADIVAKFQETPAKCPQKSKLIKQAGI
jgi:hypothetical protein